MFRNILVPFDGSPLSRRAAVRAVRFAREQHAAVTALWVAPPWQPNVSTDSAGRAYRPPRKYAARIASVAERRLSGVRRAAAAAGVECRADHVMSGFPWYEIVKAARRHRCDLVFMASRGRRGIARLLLGNETSKVLAASRIPVLVVK